MKEHRRLKKVSYGSYDGFTPRPLEKPVATVVPSSGGTYYLAIKCSEGPVLWGCTYDTEVEAQSAAGLWNARSKADVPWRRRKQTTRRKLGDDYGELLGDDPVAGVSALLEQGLLQD